MSRPTVVLRRSVVLAIAATLLLAVPASAHPYIQGGEAPVDSLASLTLDLAHGCVADEAGAGAEEGPEEPTTEVALEVHEQMRIVDVPDVDGFDVDLETDDDGDVEVVVWTATTSTERAPQLPFDAVFSGEPGDELHLRVFQGCEDLASRWVGTPDDPADEPAVGLRLVEADPDNPPPPEDEPIGEEAAPDEATEAPASPAEEPAGGEAGTEGDGAEEDADEPVTEAEDATGTAPATVPSDAEDSPLLWIVVALVAAALMLAAILALRRRPVAAVSPRAIEGDDVDAAPTGDAAGGAPTADETVVGPTAEPTTSDEATRPDGTDDATRPHGTDDATRPDDADGAIRPDGTDERGDQDPR